MTNKRYNIILERGEIILESERGIKCFGCLCDLLEYIKEDARGTICYHKEQYEIKEMK